MRLTLTQIAAGIVILSAGAAVVVLPGRAFGPERVTTPPALPATQAVALQAHRVKAPVKHRVVTTPVYIAPVVTRAVHVSAPPSKPTTVVHGTVAPRHVVRPISRPKPTPTTPTTTTPTTTTPAPTTTVPATTPPTVVAAAAPPSSVVPPPTTPTPTTGPGHDQGNGKDQGNAYGHDKGNGNGGGHGNGHDQGENA